MINTYIGIDYSQNKPASCIFQDGKIKFISWPYDLSKKTLPLFKNAGIEIVPQLLYKNKYKDASALMRSEIANANYQTMLIVDSLKPYLNKNTFISFEGSAYSGAGNSILQLTAWRYILMLKLSEIIGLDKIYTYSPLTLKSVAGCSKKDSNTKGDMIESFILNSEDNSLKNKLIDDRSLFRKKGDHTWIDHLDDLCDAYFAMKTLIVKENLKF